MKSGYRHPLYGLILVFVSAAGSFAFAGPELDLKLRRQVETSPGSGRYHTTEEEVRWDPAKTAIVICDMWNEHWCRGATARVAEMAFRMNQVVAEARRRGVLIIHCPSGCMQRYQETAQRQLAQQAPPVETKTPLRNWCHLDESREGPLPIDDSDGGCDCQPPCPQRSPWTHQIETIDIQPGDAITDSAEAYYLMRQRGIEQVIVMGVHTNMCVLGRPFSIRQLVYQGMNVALMRDLTDTMYNSRSRPFVNHHAGTDLVVEHIERHWGPTVTSNQITGGEPLRFSDDRRLHMAIVMAEDEYRTEVSLPQFARKHLGRDFRVSLVYGDARERHVIPGIEVLDDADAAILSIRRRALPVEQLDTVRRFLAAGKPLVAIRTTNHAFALRGNEQTPPGHAVWPEFDAEVLGCNYTGHHSNHPPDEPPTTVWVSPSAVDHPIVRGLPKGEFTVPSWLYKSQPLAQGTTALLMGRVGERKPHEPVAWTYVRADGGRVFYTCLGHSDDFKLADVERLLMQAIDWAIANPTDAASEVQETGHSRDRS